MVQYARDRQIGQEQTEYRGDDQGGAISDRRLDLVHFDLRRQISDQTKCDRCKKERQDHAGEDLRNDRGEKGDLRLIYRG